MASYDHPVWGKYAAITQNNYGKGLATYIGCVTSNALLERILADAVKKAGLWGEAQKLHYPLIIKQGVNERGKMVRYFFNYSDKPEHISYNFGNGKELLGDKEVNKNSELAIEPWGVKIIEEQ
jgi:beta-galactosidase